MKWIENRIPYDKLELLFFFFPLNSVVVFLFVSHFHLRHSYKQCLTAVCVMCQNRRVGNTKIQIQHRAK